MHYICTGGCKGLSDTPGVCQAGDCPKHEHPLTPCDCTDSNHYGKHDSEASGQDDSGGGDGKTE